MHYTMGYQLYKYERGLTAAEQRAADVRAGEAAAVLRDLRRSLTSVLRFAHRATTTRATAPVSRVPARTVPGIR